MSALRLNCFRKKTFIIKQTHQIFHFSALCDAILEHSNERESVGEGETHVAWRRLGGSVEYGEVSHAGDEDDAQAVETLTEPAGRSHEQEPGSCRKKLNIFSCQSSYGYLSSF